MKLPSIDIVLRGMDVIVTDILIGRADPDVGVMADYIEEYTIRDSEERVLEWILTEEEWRYVDEVIYSHLNNYEEHEK